MANRCDNHCLPLKRIINTVVSFCQKPMENPYLPMEKPYLPPEIIINILKRLRVKSLVRFRAVCKDWRDLLKSPSFIKEHLHHSTLNNPLIIWYLRTRNPVYSPLCLFRINNKGTLEHEGIPEMGSLRLCSRIVGTSNGLLCVELHDPSRTLLLLNPATREVRQVPRSTNDDGLFSSLDSGFGYSHAANDYKIVTIRRRRHQKDLDCVHLVEVFSLKTWSWKEVGFGVIRRIGCLCRSVNVDGAIFWLGHYCEYADYGVIVSFNWTTEVFTLISLPPSTTFNSIIGTPVFDYKLFVYENKVAICYLFRAGCELALWELEEESRAYGKRCVWTCKSCRLFLWMNELVCYSAKGDSVFLCNTTNNGTLKKFATSVSETGTEFIYVESLVSMGALP